MQKDQFQLPRGKWEIKLLNRLASKSLLLKQLTENNMNPVRADANGISGPVLSS